MAIAESTRRAPTRRPKVMISAAVLRRIEALADRMTAGESALAERLLDEVTRARIVAPEKLPATVVTIGNRVTYRDETTGREQTVTLAYPEDADIACRRVSVMTPIGVALLGLAEGASYYWDTRDNERRVLTVIRVAPA